MTVNKFVTISSEHKKILKKHKITLIGRAGFLQIYNSNFRELLMIEIY